MFMPRGAKFLNHLYYVNYSLILKRDCMLQVKIKYRLKLWIHLSITYSPGTIQGKNLISNKSLNKMHQTTYQGSQSYMYAFFCFYLIYLKQITLLIFLGRLCCFYCLALITLDSRVKNRRETVSYTHLRAHETLRYLVCRLLLEKKK